jgi:hypothetical protein
VTALDERPATRTVPAARGPLDDLADQLALFDDDGLRTASPWLEDVEWMVDTGETLAGIAARLGVAAESVVRELQPDRHDRPDLLARLARRDSTGMSTDLWMKRRDLRTAGGTLDVAIPADQAAKVRALVRRRFGPDTSRRILDALGIGPVAGRT